MVNKFNKCTPIDKPIIKKIKMIQRSALMPVVCSWSTACSHFKIAQNTIAVKKELNAYTSPSTAEYQNESLKVYASAPTAPAPIIAKSWLLINASLVLVIIFLAK